MNDKALESLVDVDNASSEIWLMAHDYLHRSLSGCFLEGEHARLSRLKGRVNQGIMDIRVALNEGKGG